MKPQPKICPSCLEKDKLTWDRKRQEWLCSFCIDDLNTQDDIRNFEREESMRRELELEDN